MADSGVLGFSTDEDDSLACVRELAANQEILKLVHQVMKSCLQAVSPDVFGLPWSVRYDRLPVTKTVSRFGRAITPYLPRLTRKDFQRLMPMIIYEAQKRTDGEEAAAEMVRDWEGVLENAVINLSRAEAWESQQGVHYEITSPLFDLMLNTDIASDVPINMVRTPYPMISLRPASGRKIILPSLGIKVDEVIVSRVAHESQEGSEVIGFELMQAVEPNGEKPVAGLVAFRELFIPVSLNDTTPITTRVEAMVREAGGDESKAGEWVDLVNFLVKILLYITVPNARIERYTDKTSLLSQIKAERNPKKKKKLEDDAARAFDKIVIGPETIPFGDDDLPGSGGEHREMRTHWRRGHYRQQVHGEGLTLRKLIFISPVLVRADRITESAPARKDYVVKA